MLLVFPAFRTDNALIGVLDPWNERLVTADGSANTSGYIEWGRLGEIGDLYVLPERRRRGLARQLVAGGKDWCRARGCSAVSVTIARAGEQRERLSRFYARLGFAQTGRTWAVAMLED